MSPRQALGKRRQAQIYPLLGLETINPYPTLGNGFTPLPSHHGAHPMAAPVGGMGTTMGRWGCRSRHRARKEDLGTGTHTQAANEGN